MENDEFIRWLDDRLANDPHFDARIRAALDRLRVERLAARTRPVRAPRGPEPDTAHAD